MKYCEECGRPWPCTSHTKIGPGPQMYGTVDKPERAIRPNPIVGPCDDREFDPEIVWKSEATGLDARLVPYRERMEKFLKNLFRKIRGSKLREL